MLTIGVCFILFHGGLQLSARVLGSVALGLGALVIPGVVVTAAITGAVAAAVFGLPIETGLLVGAVLAPTDPTILIPLFERLRVRRRVSQTVIAESGAQRPDRRSARARTGRGRRRRQLLLRRDGRGVRRRPGALHDPRGWRRHAAGAGRLQPPAGDLAGVVAASPA